jgi:DinB superfamily
MEQQDRARRGLILRLRDLGDDVRRLTAGFDDETLRRQTAAGKWSLIELACHLWVVQQMFEARIDAMLEREAPAFEPYAPENDAAFAALIASGPGQEHVQRFLADRDRLAVRLDNLAPAEWLRLGQHPTFGTFDIAFLVEYMAHHEAHHVYQMFTRRVPLLRKNP